MRIFGVLCLCLFASVAHGQIKLSEARTETWSGFDTPIVVDGKIVSRAGSKPKLDKVDVTIVAESAIEYKFRRLYARRLPSYERVSLDELGNGQFRFKAGTPAGEYLVIYELFDAEKGHDTDEIRVVLSADPIKPVEPVEPNPLPLRLVTAESRKAMQGLVAGMANDLDAAALEIESGKIKTVLELSSYTVPLDVTTRNVFKKQMATILEPKLGAAALPADAPATLRQVSAGFRSVK
jgi:hypothetical protein